MLTLEDREIWLRVIVGAVKLGRVQRQFPHRPLFGPKLYTASFDADCRDFHYMAARWRERRVSAERSWWRLYGY
jgi:hypothetical protein